MDRTTQKRARRRPRRLTPIIAVGVVVAIVLVWPILSHLYTDLRWFRSLGFGSVYTTVLWAKIGVGVSVGLLVGAALAANLLVAARVTRSFPALRIAGPTAGSSIDIGAFAPRLALPVAALVGLISGFSGADHWATFLRWQHAAEVGTSDPILGRDVGFYLFELPALDAACSLGMWVLIISLVGAAAMHFLCGGIRTAARGLRAERRTRVHLSVLGALFFGLLAYEAWLDAFELLGSTTGPVSGASYADVHARLPALRVEIFAALVAAVLIGISATRDRLVLLVVGVAAYLAVEIVGVRVYPAILQRFTVVPNEASKEAPFIRHNIDATRAAYGLGSVVERELSGEEPLRREHVQANQATIDNIRLWDHQPLLDTFAQIQEIRTYYEFASVDNDRYVIDGAMRQTMLSPRELSAESLPNRTWINERFTFTHGYGVTLGPVNASTSEGLPVLFVKDIPPISDLPSLQVTQPAIYFGELSNEYVFVRTNTREFDYPAGEDNVYDEYDGNDGVHLDSAFTRATVATRIGSLKLLLSDDIDEDSRVLLNRNIRERVRTLAPFLQYDSDPYMVVREDGTLVWIQDAYTVSDRYPYSQPIAGGLNYIRNSVKVVIDAYHGGVTFYVMDATDPVLQTWRSIFPSLFTSSDEMPPDVRAHVRYPEDIFAIQTQIFTTYHMDDPALIYNREDQWEIPSMRREGSVEQMTPYYTVMRLPGERNVEFIQMIPFTPKRKDNLAAWMVARSDPERLGEMIVYLFPKDRLVFGPQQVMNRISQDADISRQISLWDQRGSQAIMGTLLVIPIEESLLYVTPLYLRSEGGRIPELKRVIVAYETRIAMEPTLDGAIAALFGEDDGAAAAAEEAAETGDATGAEAAAATAAEGAEPAAEAAATATAEEAPAPTGPTGEAAQALARRARQHYERAIEAQRQGDWAGYGREIQQLERVLQRLAPSR